MLTRKQLITAKAEYLLGRPLTDKEAKILISKIKVGNMKEIKDNIQDKKNDFVPIEDVVAAKTITDTTPAEELKEVVQEIAIKSTSVESGMKMMAAAKSHKQAGLLKYIYNLYARDALSRDKRVKKTAAGREPILPAPPMLTAPHTEDPAWSYWSYYNPDQDNQPSRMDEYDSKQEYLAKELNKRPSQNEPRKEEKEEPKLKKYIHTMIGKPIPEEPNTRGGKP